jgi:hypothetical protein
LRRVKDRIFTFKRDRVDGPALRNDGSQFSAAPLRSVERGGMEAARERESSSEAKGFESSCCSTGSANGLTSTPSCRYSGCVAVVQRRRTLPIQLVGSLRLQRLRDLCGVFALPVGMSLTPSKESRKDDPEDVGCIGYAALVRTPVGDRRSTLVASGEVVRFHIRRTPSSKRATIGYIWMRHKDGQRECRELTSLRHRAWEHG